MLDRSAEVSVLVVDDDDLVRTVIALGLEDEGCEVLTAASGQQALEVLKDKPVSAAVIDLNMPALSGMALMTVIRTDWPDLPMIAISGSDPDEHLPDGVVFIPKPYQASRLHRAVQFAVLREEFGTG